MSSFDSSLNRLEYVNMEMTASVMAVSMVEGVGIYGFCPFKKKNVVQANGSNDINMYGLKPHERLLGQQ